MSVTYVKALVIGAFRHRAAYPIYIYDCQKKKTTVSIDLSNSDGTAVHVHYTK